KEDISENDATPSIGATIVADDPADDNCDDGRIGTMPVQPRAQALVSWTGKCSAAACSDNTTAGSVGRRFEPIFLFIQIDFRKKKIMLISYFLKNILYFSTVLCACLRSYCDVQQS
ncbi:hypothetical protein V8G54_024540, partial [Vigna mungo]